MLRTVPLYNPRSIVFQHYIIKVNHLFWDSHLQWRLCRPFHKIWCENLQGRKGNRCRATQRRQRPLECPSSTERDATNTGTALSKRCHQERPDETRPSCFPTGLCIQSPVLHFLPCHPTRSLRFLARPHYNPPITKHIAKSLATSKGHLRMEQQKIQSTKLSANLDLATSLDIIPAPRTKQTTNECCLHHHTNRSRATKILLQPDRQVSNTIFAQLQLRQDTLRLQQ